MGPNGDPKTEKGPHGDPGLQMGTHVGAVLYTLLGPLDAVKTRLKAVDFPVIQNSEKTPHFILLIQIQGNVASDQ